MPGVETITGIIGFLAVTAGAVINIIIGNLHKDDPMKNLLLLTGGMGILSLVFLIVFPPLGVLLLITTLVLNTISSLNEANQDYYWKIDLAAFLTVAGLIMTSLSAYYGVLKALSPDTAIPGFAIIAIIIGVILVFFGAIVNFYVGRQLSCANAAPTCVPDLSARNYHYILGATLLGSLALMPALFMINKAMAFIGIIMIIGVTIGNLVLAEHSLNDPVIHWWSNVAAWLSGIGLLMFTLVIWYIGSVNVKPTYIKSRRFIPERIAAEPLPVVPDPIITKLLESDAGRAFLDRAIAERTAAARAAAPIGPAPRAGPAPAAI